MLDDFRRTNDSSGHAAGDEVLRFAATTDRRLPLRRSDRAFRVGGDEFAIIMPSTDAERGQQVVRRLLAACLEGEPGRDQAVTVSFSAGVSAIPGKARDRERLYGQAEAALHWAKLHGRTCVVVHDPDVHDGPIVGRPPAELSALVSRIAATGALRAVFQPIYDLTSGAPRGFEGLVRPSPGHPASPRRRASSMFMAAEATRRTASSMSSAPAYGDGDGAG